jgi:DGQHR domain-containing protein
MAGFTVGATVLRQKNLDLYLFAMNSAHLNKIAYVTPRSHDDPTEIQRILNEARVAKITKYIQEANTLLPTAIVVSLGEEVLIRDTEDPKRKIITFPDKEGKFAYILDGQHRLAGFKNQPTQFDLPVVAMHGADEATRAKVFADINSKQERITDVLILELYYQIKELSPDEAFLLDVIHLLNTADDSPIAGKVKVLDDDRGTWVKNTILKRFLKPAVAEGGLNVVAAGQAATIVREYLKALRNTWPEAWGNNKEYSLSSSVGLEVMIRVLPVVKGRVDLNAGREYTAKNFEDQLRPLKNVELRIPVSDGVEVPLILDWKKDSLNLLSRGQKGRNLLVDELRRVLHAADAPTGDT